MLFNTIALLLSILPVVLSTKTCSVSTISRKSCQINTAIVDQNACLAVGCCFDPTAPAAGKCYQQGHVLNLGHYGAYNPTQAPPREGGNTVLTVGGEPGFQGSQILLKCNLGALCIQNSFYNVLGKRNGCIRQGCCWRNGNCYKNTFQIISLRSKCPDGFKDPPKCEEHNPCMDATSPCKNGGACKHTGPGKFVCTCLPGFSGLTCNANCKASTINKGRMLPATADYVEGQDITLACNAGATSQPGAVTARKCLNGDITPKLSTDPFTCSSDCTVEAVSKATAGTTAATVTHGVGVTYTCDAGTTSASANVLTRTCTDGHLMPLLSTTPIVCDSDCTVETVTNAKADKTALKHGESVTYTCGATFSSTSGQTLTRTCKNGALTPSLTDDKIVCYADCTVTAPSFSTATPSDATVKHGVEVTFACQASHAGSAAAETKRTCANGHLSPDFVAQPYVCSENCGLTQIANAETMPAVLIHGKEIALKCLSTHTSLVGAESKRTCDGGKLVPDLVSKPFTCHKTCTVDAVTDATSTPSKGSPLVHLGTVTYECVDKHTHQTGAQLTRTCQNGNLDPPLGSSAITCSGQCKVVSAGVNTESSVGVNTYIDHGASVVYNCIAATHSSLSSAQLTRTCSDGRLLPDLGTTPIQCFPHCPSPTALTHGSFAPVLAINPLGTVVTYSCGPNYTPGGTDVLQRKCEQSGAFEPSLTTSVITCSQDCFSPTVVPGAHVVTSQPIHNGATLTYACDTDYVKDGSSTMTRTCTNGAVLPDPLNAASLIKCYKPCTFTMPTNAKVTTAAPFEHGSKVTFACNDGWTSPAGATHERDCVDGALSPGLVATPYLCNKDCSAPASVTGTTFKASASGKYHHGDKVNYVCDADTTTEAETERECTNGEFLPTLAAKPIKCYPSCTPEPLTGGDYLPKYAPAQKHAHNTFITYSCDNGKSHPASAMTQRTCTGGSFQPTLGANPIVCSDDCAINNVVGESNHNQGVKTHIKHGEAVTYTCKTGFSHPSLASSVQTCANGVLKPTVSSPVFQCFADCATPTKINNGKFTPEATVKHDQPITFACNPGHTSLSTATLVRTCKNGKFDPEIGAASPLQCYQNCVPEKPTNGYHSPKETTYAHTSEITYKCNNKFSPSTNNDLKRTCTDGEFLPKLADKPISCLEDCDVESRAEATHKPTATTVVAGTVVTYTCRTGWSPGVGGTKMERTCTAGKLEPDMSGATDVKCYQNCVKPTPTNELTIGPATTDNFYIHKTVLTYSCSATFSLPRGAKNTKTCENGNLVDATALVCEKDCTAPTKPTSGQVTLQNGLLHGDQAVMSCDPKFSYLTTAQNTLTCSSGNWSPTLAASNFICYKDCETLPAVANSVVSPIQATYRNTDSIVISCAPDHTLVGEAGVSRVCTNGDYIPTLLAKPAACKKMCTVEEITNGITSVAGVKVNVDSKVDFNAAATLSCNSGYTSLSGAVAGRACSENGEWDPKLKDKAFTCHKDCTVTAPTDGSIKQGKTTFNHLEPVEYKCNAQRTLVGTAKRTCKNGNLDPAGDVECKKQCEVKNFDGGAGTSPAGTWVDHDAHETFVCSSGHITTHTLKRKCVDGHFDPAVDDVSDPLKCYQECVLPSNFGSITTPPASVAHDGKYTYTCLSTHTMDANSQPERTCTDGVLSPAIGTNDPQCWLKCTDVFPTITHATTTPTSAPINHGETVVYSCGTNYDALKNQKLTRTCKNGNLDPLIDSNNPISCHQNCDVTKIDNANTDVTTAKIKSGEKVVYTCDNTHSPATPSTVLTRACDGGVLYPEFNSDPLECKRKCDVSKTTVLLSTSDPPSGEVNHGKFVTYTCNNNHKTDSGKQSFQATCNDGTLENIEACNAQCLVPPLTSGSATPAVGKYFNHKAEVTFQCDTDFSTKHKVKRTCEKGSLDPPIDANNPLACFSVCKTITTITNASPQPSSGPVDHGDTVTYTCQGNNNHLTGVDMTTTCDNGNFVTTNIVCYPQCQVPMIPGLKSPTSLSYSPVSPSTDVTFECNTHFMSKKDEHLVRRCTTGYWVPAFNSAAGNSLLTCEQMCEVPTNIDHSTAKTAADTSQNAPAWVQNGLGVTFVCDADHRTSDQTTRTCNLGNWNPPIVPATPLKCYADCKTVPTPAGSLNTHVGNVLHGSSVTYTCDASNHYMLDPDATAKANLVAPCSDGTVDVAKVLCVQKCEVPDLTADNAYVQQNGVTKAPTLRLDHDSVINLMCTSKSTPVPRVSSGTVQRTCDNGNWNPKIDNNSPFKCHAKCTVLAATSASPAAGQPAVNDQVNHGVKVTYACAANHATASDLEYECIDGVWSPAFTAAAPLVCLQQCDVAAVATVHNSVKTPATGMVNSGDDVTFTCSGNYNADSATPMKVKCTTGTWAGHTYTSDCKSKCSHPVFANLKTPAVGTFTDHSTSATVTWVCKDGFAPLSGQTVDRKCEDGTWSAGAFECKQSCQVTYALETVRGSSAPLLNEYVKFDETLTYTCKSGYSTTQTTTRKCGAAGAFDGVALSTASLQCYADCTAKTITGATGEQAASHTGVVTYSCASGYEVAAGSTMQATCTDGTWNIANVQCVQKCTVSTSTVANSKQGGLEYSQGSNVIQCATDYTPDSTDLSRTCTNGVWSPTFADKAFHCRASCTVQVMTNGAIVSGQTVGSTQPHNTKLTLACNPNHKASGEPEEICNDGTWDVVASAATPDTRLTCTANCQASSFGITDATIAPTTPYIVHDTKATYTCDGNRNFWIANTASDSIEILCDAGTIASSGKTCYSKCAAPTTAVVPDIASPTGYSNHNDATKVTFTCSGTKQPRSADVDQRLCKNGNWDPDFGSSIMMCKDPCTVTELTNSDPTPALNAKVRSGGEVSYTCKNGFSSESATKSTCNEGTWDPLISTLKCSADCTVPDILNLKTPTKGSSVATKAAAYTFECAHGYQQKTSQVMTRTCTNGVWSLDFGSNPIECQPKCTVETVANADADKSGFVPETEKVKYTCKTDYSKGSSTMELTCTNGVWDPPITATSPKCYRDCSTIVAIDNTNTVPPTGPLKHQDTVTYTCTTPQYQTADGATMVHTCSDGTLTATGAGCVSKCKGEDVANATPLKDSWNDHKATPHTYACLSGYDLISGTVDRTCTNGVWSPPMNQNPIECKQQCTATIKTGTQVPSATTGIKHNDVVTYKCQVGYTLEPGQVLSYTCKDGQLSPDVTNLKCNRDPDVEIFFAYNGATSVDDCSSIKTAISQNWPYTVPTLIAASKGPNFLAQIATMQEIESQYVTASNTRTRMGIYSNDGTTCAASQVKRQLAQTDTSSMASLMTTNIIQYECTGTQGLDDVLLCVNNNGFVGKLRTPPKNKYLIYFVADHTDTASIYTTYAGTSGYNVVKDIFVIAIETRPRSDSRYATSQNLFDTVMSSTSASNKIYGKFIGSVHDSTATLMTEIRKYLKAA